MTLTSGLVLGKKIGNGHFGVVHRATDPVHGDVACKVFRQDPSETPAEWQDRKAGMLAEGQKLALATHHNVVRVHHLVAADTGDAVLLVMELCTGGSHQDGYKKGPMLLSDVRRVGTQVTLGLHALHARGMLHRDLKPANLLIGADGRTLLGDFGLVTDNLVMGYGSQQGYSDHLAPEIFAGHGTSARSDIWALGMTIYRLLHGAYWYDLAPPPRYVVQHGGYADTLRWLPHVPDKWRRTIRRMLRDDPAQRYQSASDLISAFAELPVEPDWACDVSPAGGTWHRRIGNRQQVAQWIRHSERVHEWKAWSEPFGTGGGRKQTLAGSNSKAGSKATMSALHHWLCR